MIKRKRYQNIIGILVIFILIGCRKDKPAAKDATIISIDPQGVFIVNEGNFQFGNAKVSYYDPKLNTANEDLFHPANSRPLGDVCQSMYLLNQKAYLVINNSNKIEVVNRQSFVSTATITGFSSPRFFLPVSNNKAYVTDFKSNAVAIVDLTKNAITGSIPCKGWTEELILAYGKAFITNQKSNKVYVVNTATDVLSDSIQVGYAANSIREDKNGKLWVLCGGNGSAAKASLHRIDAVNNLVEQSFSFSNTTDSPWRLHMNGTSDTLYYLNHGVFRMPINSSVLPEQTFIPEKGSKFYGLGIDPSTGIIYVADAVDYVQRGIIYRYHPNGHLINNFYAGINPGDFYFN